MPLYNYRGRREASGEVVRGVREAGSHAELGQVLLQEGVLLTRYELQRKKNCKFGLLLQLTQPCSSARARFVCSVLCPDAAGWT